MSMSVDRSARPRLPSNSSDNAPRNQIKPSTQKKPAIGAITTQAEARKRPERMCRIGKRDLMAFTIPSASEGR
jgi:hypothetical protein